MNLRGMNWFKFSVFLVLHESVLLHFSLVFEEKSMVLAETHFMLNSCFGV